MPDAEVMQNPDTWFEVVPWLTLQPQPDITAYELWQCMQIGSSLHPDRCDGIPETVRRHYAAPKKP